MKNGVTLEEVNAAAVLLTGVSSGNLVELHVSNGIVSGIVTTGDELKAIRIPVLLASEADGSVEVEEADEDDGS